MKTDKGIRSYIPRRTFVKLGVVATGSLLLAGCTSGGAGNTERAVSSNAADKATSSIAASSSVANSSVSSASSGTSAAAEISDTRFFFDTTCLVRGVMEPEVLEGVFDRCDFFQRTLSAQEAGSDIDRINNAGGKPVEVQPETAEVIQLALRYCKESEGLFDITIGAASLLWDFKDGVVPDKAELEEAITHIDYTQVKVDGTTVQLDDPAAKLDVGGVAKGYIADDLIDYLRSYGVESGFVNLGGNVKTLGLKPDGSPWMVGVQDPNQSSDMTGENNNAIARVAASTNDTSVVTSGLYERVFEQDGTRYWHILNPRTGYPVDTNVISATIVSDESIDGDGFTKALFMWPSNQVEAFFEAHPKLQGLIIYADGTTWQSPNSTIELR